MQSFDELALPPALSAALKAMNFSVPTPIQAQSIPPALEGKDVLGTAMTGSGKTAAFSIPMISKLTTNSRGSAMILTPTRELAQQVQKVIIQLVGPYSPLKTALLIGGDSMPGQLQQLRARPRIIVGTPGRIIDHLQRGSLMLHDTGFLVLDEMDRMLDMGFGDQIAQIFKYLPLQRQTLLFSATLPPQIQKIAATHLKNPVRIEVGNTNKAAEKIVQETRNVSNEGKFDLLLSELKVREGTVIIFVRAKYATEKLAMKLRKAGFTADAIHGDLQQKQRERVLKAFREKHHRILVATDIASRGLDIPHIEHVVNYDLPMQPEDYIHRIGRTARAGAEGHALSFITGEDRIKWNEIQKLMDPTFKPEPRPQGAPGAGGGNGGNGGGANKKRRRGGGRNRNRGGQSGQGGGNRGGQGHGGGSAPRAAQG